MIKTLRLKQRGKDKPFHTPEQKRAMARVAQLMRIYRRQYPNGLPHNSLGVKYARYMCRTLAFFDTIEGRERWLDRYASWMAADKRAAILNMCPHWYSKKSLGEHLDLCDADREELQAWSIEAMDVDEDQRAAINQVKNRRHQERHRRKNESSCREEYLAASTASQTKPWVALCESRRTYYRWKARETRLAQVRKRLLCFTYLYGPVPSAVKTGRRQGSDLVDDLAHTEQSPVSKSGAPQARPRQEPIIDIGIEDPEHAPYAPGATVANRNQNLEKRRTA